MCTTCGCSDDQRVSIDGQPVPGEVHAHADSGPHHHHGHDHAHDGEDHVHGPDGEIIRLEQNILARNDDLAKKNREWFAAHQILALNLLGSPGAGKTSLLEHTLTHIDIPGAVVEGDQSTEYDAERIRAAGARAVQINTGPGCHLEADMLARGIESLSPKGGSILFIENVGNLVCPALFDLGEFKRVLLLSVTEGEDKPIKYPHMFRSADLLLLNKCDLLPHLQFDVRRCIGFAREVNPGLEVVSISATSGEGMQGWFDWLRRQHAQAAVTGSVTGENVARMEAVR